MSRVLFPSPEAYKDGYPPGSICRVFMLGGPPLKVRITSWARREECNAAQVNRAEESISNIQERILYGQEGEVLGPDFTKRILDKEGAALFFELSRMRPWTDEDEQLMQAINRQPTIVNI